MLRLEARPQPSKLMSLLSPVLALVLTAIIAALLFTALGKDPVRGLGIFFVEPWSNLRQVSELLLKATPLIVIALGLAVCYRSNVWNIGAEGQFLLGVLAGGGVALWLTTAGIVLPKIVAVPLVLIGGVLGGMAWASITALLRDKFNASEILVSLMLVYVAQQLVNYMVFGPWKDPAGFNFPQTKSFDASTWLPNLLPGTRLHIGIAIGLAFVALVWVFMFRLFRGYQLQVGGLAVDRAAHQRRPGRHGRRHGGHRHLQADHAACQHGPGLHRHHRLLRRPAASGGHHLRRAAAVDDDHRRRAGSVAPGPAERADRRFPGPAAGAAAGLRHLDPLPHPRALGAGRCPLKEAHSWTKLHC
jgi:ABC-type uncharacterized transport system permease subunit